MTRPETQLAFKTAIESRDIAAVRQSLAPDIRFHSAVRYTPFEGRDTVAAVLQIPAAVFGFHDGFRYTRVFSAGNEYALFFEADIDGRFLEGVDLLRLDKEGLVAELRVMMRPLAEIQRFAAAAADIIGQQTSP